MMAHSIKRIGAAVLTGSALVFNLMWLGCSPSPTSKNNANISVSDPSLSLLDEVQNRGVIRVGTTGDYLPYSYQLNSESNIYYGVDIELAKDLGKSLGADVQFVKTTWPTLMEDMTSNKFDIGMGGITITLSRQKKALFSIPIFPGGKAAITRDENANKYNTIAGINKPGVRVIVNPGGTNEVFSKENFPKATLILNDNNVNIFQKIVDGEADVMVTDADETLIQELIHPELEAVNPREPFNFFEKGYLLPRDHTFKAYIDQWVNLRQKDGTFQKIFDEELEKIRERTSKKE